MQADDANSGVIFDSVIWRGDHMVEVSFTEERDRGDGVALVRTVVVDRRLIAQFYSELVTSLIDFINEAQVLLRLQPRRENEP